MLTKEEILDKHDVFVGSQATEYGEALARHDEFQNFVPRKSIKDVTFYTKRVREVIYTVGKKLYESFFQVFSARYPLIGPCVYILLRFVQLIDELQTQNFTVQMAQLLVMKCQVDLIVTEGHK